MHYFLSADGKTLWALSDVDLYNIAHGAMDPRTEGYTEATDEQVSAIQTPWLYNVADAATYQLAQVAATFAAQSATPFVDTNGVSWPGGKSEVQTVASAIATANLISEQTVTLYDTANAAHTLSIADATTLLAALTNAYQTILAKYQAAQASIDALAAADGTTVAQIQAITI